MLQALRLLRRCHAQRARPTDAEFKRTIPRPLFSSFFSKNAPADQLAERLGDDPLDDRELRMLRLASERIVRRRHCPTTAPLARRSGQLSVRSDRLTLRQQPHRGVSIGSAKELPVASGAYLCTVLGTGQIAMPPRPGSVVAFTNAASSALAYDV